MLEATVEYKETVRTRLDVECRRGRCVGRGSVGRGTVGRGGAVAVWREIQP